MTHNKTDNIKNNNFCDPDDGLDSDFSRIINTAINRRRFMGLAGKGMAAFFLTSPLSQAVGAATTTQSQLLGFEAIKASTADTVTLPKGYQYQVLMSWGDPIFLNAPAFDPSGKGTASAQAMQFGDNTDGMTFFARSNTRGVLAVNNEYVNPEHLFDHQGKKMTKEDVRKAQAAHGVTIVEIEKKSQGWQINKTGEVNRRITANTPIDITGPAAGDDLLKTAADPKGTQVLGTINNCANGQTPWGTYLTCEENFNKYFGAGADGEAKAEANAKVEANVKAEALTNPSIKPSEAYKRYGIKPTDKYFKWSYFDERFDFTKNPNEPNRFGWVVEIDPFDPHSKPKKRTALGRFKHENAALVVDPSGHVVVYLGDDQRGEHLYKFVSKTKYQEGGDNRELLAEGTLYVAKFDAQEGELKGKGQWLELTHNKNGLTPENGFKSQAEVLIHARLAATHVGATTMDRPEWVAVHPDKKTIFCTLTNNKKRGQADQPVGGPNPRAKNLYGQIIRWTPSAGDHTSDRFEWDVFVLAGNPSVHQNNLYAGSDNINSENMFNSPDGIGFDADGRLWIQTDGKYSNSKDFAGMGNNQMLCADPSTGEIRRFMTGPIACEVTGLTFSPDYTTLFVGIQHPGEKSHLQASNTSHFPAGGDSKPRSSIIAISRIDGGVVGS